jgi:hypothetical protein
VTGKKRLLPLGFMVILCGITLSAVLRDPDGAAGVLRRGWDHPAILAEALEEFLQENLPFREELRGGVLRLRMLGGSSEQNGVFLVEDGLVENLTVTGDTTLHRNNTRQILAVMERSSSPAHFMLIPTACAIYQDRLPEYAPLYNQRGYIDNTYKQFYGTASTVDAYNALLYSDSDYLYYRTEGSLTALGGYALYQVLGARLGFVPRPLSQFEIDYQVHDYYGNLYQRWGYGGVRGDVIATCRDTQGGTTSRVLNWERYGPKTYHTLYPREAAVSGDGLDVILGGHAPRIEIFTEGGRSSSLLVLGDRTALSYLPFLAGHYQKITFLDLSLLTASEIGAFDPDDYTQILFAYSMDTYLNTEHPSKAGELGPAAG